MRFLTLLAGLALAVPSALHAAAPLNDNFTNALVITGLNVLLKGTNTAATRELGEPSHAGNTAAHSLWWKWTAPSNQTVFIDTLNSTFPTVLAVYTGTNVASLTTIASDPDGSDLVDRLNFVAVAGTTYRIVVDGRAGASGTIFLNFRSVPPVNDRFDQAALISGTDITSLGSVEGAMLEPGEPAHTAALDFPPRNSVWWRWTAPLNGMVTVDTRGSSFDTFLAVYTGSSVSNLTQIRSNDDEAYPTVLTSRTNFPCTFGVQYNVAAGGFGYQSTGDVVLHLTLAGSAPSIQGQPDNVAVNMGTSVDFQVIAIGSTPLYYQWRKDGAPIAGANASTLHIALAQPADAGVYSVAVTNLLGGTTSVGAVLVVHSQVSNDNFVDAFPITGTSNTVFGSNADATQESGEPYLYGGRTVWWRWTAPVTGKVVLDTVGSPPYTALAVYTGDAISNLNLLASDNRTGGNVGLVVLRATAGTVYRIQVDGYNTGDVMLNIGRVNLPANDDFTNAIPITGLSGIFAGSTEGATMEPGEPADNGDASVWWKWTAPSTGKVVVDTVGSTDSAELSVYQGSSISNLTLIDTGPLLTLFATAGAEYRIAVHSTYHVGPVLLNIGRIQPPANDDFAAATSIMGWNTTVTGSSVGATLEPGEPPVGDPPGRHSVWWSWTSPFTRKVIVDVTGVSGFYSARLEVYAGDSVSNLAPVPSGQGFGANRESLVAFRATIGTTYRIAVNGDSGESGNYVLSVGRLQPQVNDDFADATPIVGTNNTVTGANVNATQEAQEPNHGNNYDVHSVWWRWVAPISGRMLVDSAGSSFNPVLAVYRGNSVSNLTPVANAEMSYYAWSLLGFTAIAGTEYRIAVDGGYSGGDIVLSVGRIQAPPNDDFSHATRLSGASVTTNGSNVGASREPGESTVGEHSVWWKWTAPFTGKFIVDTLASAAFVDLAVFTGDSVSNLTRIATGEPLYEHGGQILTLNAVAGTEYTIGVSGSRYDSNGGDIVLGIGRLPVPSNDDFTRSIPLSGTNLTVSGSNLGATEEPGEPRHGWYSSSHSVWWHWTADSDRTVVFDTIGSAFDTYLAVYTGNSVSNLQLVAGGGPDETDFLSFAAARGVVYYIAIDSGGGESGDIALGVGRLQLPPNDNFADAIAISGTNVTASGSNVHASAEPGEPYQGGHSIWWKWHANMSGMVSVGVRRSDFYASVRVYTGESVASLSRVSGSSSTDADLLFTATAGTTYYIAVDGFNRETGDIVLDLGTVPLASNDNLADEILLTGTNVTVIGSNLGATSEPGEAHHGDLARGHSVWWRWTAPSSGRVRVDTIGTSSYVALAIYTGDTFSNFAVVARSRMQLVPNLNQVGFLAVAGEVYHIAVDGDHGRIVLHVEALSAPENDDFANALNLTGTNVSAFGRNEGATSENGEPPLTPASSGNSVWWKWVAPTNGSVTVDTSGSTFEASLTIYTGADLDHLSLLDQDNQTAGRYSQLTFFGVVGTTYWLRVDAADGLGGGITLHLRQDATAGGEPVHPVFVASWPGFTTGPALGLTVTQSLCFVAIGEGGLLILDVSDPTRPRRVGSIVTRGRATKVQVSQGYAYVANGQRGLCVIDVHDPSAPVVVNELLDLRSVQDIAIRDGVAFVADGIGGLLIYDLGTPNNPWLLSAVPGGATRVVLDGSLAYLAQDGLNVIDVANPAHPRIIGGTSLVHGPVAAVRDGYVFEPGIYLEVTSVRDPVNSVQVSRIRLRDGALDDPPFTDALIQNDHLYLAYGHGITVVDITDPIHPRRILEGRSVGEGSGVAVADGYAYLASGSHGVAIFDLSIRGEGWSPFDPVLHLDRIFHFQTLERPADIAVQGNQVYLATRQGGVAVLDISNPASPLLLGSAGGYVTGVAAEGAYVLASSINIPEHGDSFSFSGGLASLDVADPVNPQFVGGFSNSAPSWGVTLRGTRGCLLVPDQPCFGDGFAEFETQTGNCDYREITVLDLSDRTNPVRIWSTNYSELLPYGESLTKPALWGGYTYLATEMGFNIQSGTGFSFPLLGAGRGVEADLDQLAIAGANGVEVFDLTIPDRPARRAVLARIGSAYIGVAISEHHLIATDENTGLHVLDSNHGPELVEVGSYGERGFGKVVLAGNYAIVAHGSQGITILDLGPSFRRAPAIMVQPRDFRALPGQEIRFDVGAKGTVPIRYQWMFNTTNSIPGATNFVFDLPSVQAASAGLYSCLMVNSVGSTSTIPARLEVDFPPHISWIHPQEHETFLAPSAVTLEVQVSDVEPTGSVAQVEFYSGTQLLTNVAVTPYRLTLNGISPGDYTFTARATDNEGASTVSDPITISVLTNRVFQLTQTNYVVNESNRTVIITVRRNDATAVAQINLQTLNNTASAADASGSGQYFSIATNLSFAPSESTKQISIDIVDDRVYRGNTAFLVQLFNPSPDWSLAYPSNALVSIIDDDDPVTADSFTDIVKPQPAPGGEASLQVNLSPALGKWRFEWEIRWRENGSAAEHLVPGDYVVEFMPLSGHLTPPIASMQLQAGAHKHVNYFYTPGNENPGTGTLRVSFLPAAVAAPGQGQWHLQTAPELDAGWHSSGEVVANLRAGRHVVEFAPLAGYRTPDPMEFRIRAGQTTNYLVAYEPVGGFLANGPLPLPGFTASLDDSFAAGAPYSFCGQLRSDLGYGSGFVVQPRTVLTAAHVVFDGLALSYVDNVWWFFQKDRGLFDPPGRRPRGWYVLGGYASSRTNDVLVDHMDPSQSSIHSQDRDVAALFFLNSEDPADTPPGAGRNGAGGYLTSTTNLQWLTLPLFKKLVGYPLEGVPEDARGQLHESRDFFDALRRDSNQVYSTARVISFGGNSGGPLCVQTLDSAGNQFYIPAGVYLGGSGRSVVRAIDLDVVNLVLAAEYSGNAGTNSTTGGAITVVPNIHPGQAAAVLDIVLADSEALRRGGGWRISPTNYGGNPYLSAYTNFTSSPGTLFFLTNTFTIDLQDVPCFLTPTNRRVQLTPGQNFLLNLEYLPICPQLHLDMNNGLAIWGRSGGIYRIETASSLVGGGNWSSIQTQSLNGLTNWIPGTRPAAGVLRLYRAKTNGP
jgi:hypothetical protein